MNSNWQTPCLRGVIGSWVFYPSLLTADQIAKHVMSAKDIRESKELDDYLQRDLKPRVIKIAEYLKSRDSRFFNSVLLGIFDAIPNWIEFDLKPLAEKLKLGEVPEIQSSMGLMSFSGSEKIFAIDGQHRIEGIRKCHKDFSDQLKTDQFPVIFLAHSDTKDGKVRTRRLFCDINKNAVPVSEGDRVIIDEDDICAIVTRRLYAEYAPFQKGKDIAVTERKEVLIEGKRERFTSLLGIFSACKRLKRLIKMVPDTLESNPANVAELYKVAKEYFDFIVKHEKSLNRYFSKKRRNPGFLRKGNKNLLFRPAGLEVLAQLFARFSKKKCLPIFSWGLENLQWTSPGGVFDNTIWQSGFIDHRQIAKNAAVDNCLYLLRQLSNEKAAKLLETITKIAKNPPQKLADRANLPDGLLSG
jgi:DNA sulfur modification protein DndB